MFQINQLVYWRSSVNFKKIERAGFIVAVVPAGESPEDYVPAGVTFKLHGKPRSTVSYLIRVPDVHYLFWPTEELSDAFEAGKMDVLGTQPKSKRHFILRSLNRDDRKKLLMVAYLDGAKIIETKEMLEVVEWRTRFWFGIEKGVEFIKSIDRW